MDNLEPHINQALEYASEIRDMADNFTETIRILDFYYAELKKLGEHLRVLAPRRSLPPNFPHDPSDFLEGLAVFCVLPYLREKLTLLYPNLAKRRLSSDEKTLLSCLLGRATGCYQRANSCTQGGIGEWSTYMERNLMPLNTPTLMMSAVEEDFISPERRIATITFLLGCGASPSRQLPSQTGPFTVAGRVRQILQDPSTPEHDKEVYWKKVEALLDAKQGRGTSRGLFSWSRLRRRNLKR